MTLNSFEMVSIIKDDLFLFFLFFFKKTFKKIWLLNFFFDVIHHVFKYLLFKCQTNLKSFLSLTFCFHLFLKKLLLFFVSTFYNNFLLFFLQFFLFKKINDSAQNNVVVKKFIWINLKLYFNLQTLKSFLYTHQVLTENIQPVQ